jgi:hypothetical protein
MFQEPLNLSGAAIHAVQTLRRSYPERTPAVLCDRIDLVMTQAPGLFRIMQKHLKGVLLPVVTVQSMRGPDPQLPVGIFVKIIIHDVVPTGVDVTREGTGLVRVYFVPPESFTDRIVPLQSGSIVPDPELVMAVHIHTCDPAVGRSPWGYPLKIGAEFIPVEPVQPVLGPEPEKSEAVLFHGLYKAVRKPVFHSQVVKTDF